MDIVLNYVDRRIQVRQDIDLTNTTLDPWAEIVFAVPPAHQADVFVLERAEVTTVDHHRVVPGRLTGIMLSLPLQDLVNPGDPMRVRLVYEIRVPAIDPTRWLPEGNLGMGERVLQVGDWHPTLVPYGEGDGWQTWDYHPVGDPVVYPIADYDVQLSADPRVVVAAPGFQSQQGLRRTYLLTEARSFAFLASPEYRVIASSTLGMSLRTYYLPGNERAARATLTTAVQAIELFEELYGPYPSDELIIAQNAYLGSMEYSGLLSISTEAYDTYVANPGALLVGLVVHETAHQWWYGAVGNDQVHEPWLDEAFAKYSELLFYEHYEPDLVPWWWDTHVMRYGPEGSLNRTIYDFDGTPDYFSELYGQAARFLADLRREMGNEEFFRFVRAYRQQGEGALVTGEAFFQLLLASTDKDLSELIDRYFDNPDG